MYGFLCQLPIRRDKLLKAICSSLRFILKYGAFDFENNPVKLIEKYKIANVLVVLLH